MRADCREIIHKAPRARTWWYCIRWSHTNAILMDPTSPLVSDPHNYQPNNTNKKAQFPAKRVTFVTFRAREFNPNLN